MHAPGMRLFLSRSIPATSEEDDFLTLPAGAIILILPGYDVQNARMDVAWTGLTISLSTADVGRYGREIPPKRAAALTCSESKLLVEQS